MELQLNIDNRSQSSTVTSDDQILHPSGVEPEPKIQFRHDEFQNIDFCFDQCSQIHDQKVIFVVLDFETTGLDVHSSEITQIAALPLLTSELNLGFTSLTKTQRPYKNIYNKITYEMLEQAPSIEYVLSEFVKWLENLKNKYQLDKIFILAHNSKFDEAFLRVNLSKLQYTIPFEIHFVDTILAARNVLGTSKNSISDLCQYFNIPIGSNQHTAPADIALLTQILKCIFNTAFDDNIQARFEKWILNPDSVDEETWFCRKKIMDKHKVSKMSPVARKIQRAMFGIPNSAKNLNTKNMKLWQLILPESEFAKIKFEHTDSREVLGSTLSLISFHEVVIYYFANLTTCSYMSISTKTKCSSDKNLILSNLPYTGYVCQDCHNKNTSLTFDLQKCTNLLKTK